MKWSTIFVVVLLLAMSACIPAAAEDDYNSEAFVTNYVTEIAQSAGNKVERTLYYSQNPAVCTHTDGVFECQSFGGPVVVQRYAIFWVQGDSALYPCNNCTVLPNRKETHSWGGESRLLSSEELKEFLKLKALAEAEQDQ